MTAEKTISEKIFTNKFLPFLLLPLNIYIFFYLIPIDIAERFFIICSIVGGVITMILSFWLFGTLLPKLYDTIPIILGLTCISTLFIFGVFFIKHTTHFSSNELAKNGVHTEAVIYDTTRLIGRRGRTSEDIDVSFITEEGAQANANILVSKKHYQMFKEGMMIPIIYSSKYPHIATIDYRKLNLQNKTSPYN